MTYASLTSVSRNTYRRNQNNIHYSSRASALGPVSNLVVLLILTSLLVVFYLSQVVSTNGYSDRLNTLNQQKVQLEEANTTLQLEAARLQSTERVSSSGIADGLTDPKAVDSHQAY